MRVMAENPMGRQQSGWRYKLYRAGRGIRRNWGLYLLLLPAVVLLFCFNYLPMYGVQIAFKDFSPSKGIQGSPWVGFANFQKFFNSFQSKNLIWNTVSLSLYSLIAGVRLFLRFCRQQKHAVCQIIKRFVVHFAPPFKIVIILIFIIADNWQKVKPYFRCIYKKERRANRSFSLCSVLLFFSNDSKTSRLGNPCNWVSYGSNVHRTFEPTFLVFGYAKRFRFLRKANQGSALITCKFSEENLTKDF